MTHILLIGAGFSRNWGGLLANEFFDHLIGKKAIREDSTLRKLLWKTKDNGGFETALEKIQVDYRKNPKSNENKLKVLQSSILEIFEGMNKAFFSRSDFEFQQYNDKMLKTFMFKFDAIFTLNQDVLLEHHYCKHVELSDQSWLGPCLPGMKQIANNNTLEPSWGKDIWVPISKDEFKIENNCQPLFKLHGSSNWKYEEGNDLLIIGGQKIHAINNSKILSWYFEKLKEYLEMPGAKLCVIGYGFRDSHVNDLIIKSVLDKDLQFFVIDNNGSNVVRHANNSYGGAVYSSNELDDAFEKGLIGASSRSLSETFGGDQVSFSNVNSFFD